MIRTSISQPAFNTKDWRIGTEHRSSATGMSRVCLGPPGKDGRLVLVDRRATEDICAMYTAATVSLEAIGGRLTWVQSMDGQLRLEPLRDLVRALAGLEAFLR